MRTNHVASTDPQSLGLPPMAQMHAHDRILVLLKIRGERTGLELARELGITGEGVRQQLQRLSDQGLVTATTQIRGRGRPVQIWKLTAAANRRFPDAHPELTSHLIDLIRKTLGEAAFVQLIEAQAQHLLSKYSDGMAGVTGVKARLERLVALRNADGYMAEFRQEKGAFLLVQNHCPICAATKACLGLCTAEAGIFKNLLGPLAIVTRVEHIATGSRRCVYRVEDNSAAVPMRAVRSAP